MRIYLVRHGESLGNKNPAVYFEKLDCEIDLTEKGKGDAVNAGKKLMDLANEIRDNNTPEGLDKEPINFNLYHSSYVRAKRTAEIVDKTISANPGYNINNVYETPLIREREWGSLRELVEQGIDKANHFNFYYRPINGESFADAYQRAIIFHYSYMINSPYENNIVVAHGEFNRVYLLYLLNEQVSTFDKWKNMKNGEVFLVIDGKLSPSTPVTERYIKH